MERHGRRQSARLKDRIATSKRYCDMIELGKQFEWLWHCGGIIGEYLAESGSIAQILGLVASIESVLSESSASKSDGSSDLAILAPRTAHLRLNHFQNILLLPEYLQSQARGLQLRVPISRIVMPIRQFTRGII